MKTIETVIKQKYKFRGRTGWREEDYFILYERPFYEEDFTPLYVSNNGVRSKNIISLLKEMKSLIVFLFSCVKYDEEANDTDEETRKLHFKLKFRGGPWGGSELDLTDSIFSEFLHWYNMPIHFVESVIKKIESARYYMSFEFSFTIILSLIRIDLDRFIVDPDINLDYISSDIIRNNIRNNVRNRINKNKNEGIIPINEGKTFKSELCVIRVERIPNVLFCACRHICVCEECNKTRESLKDCPICKTENTILRIIE